MVDVQKLFFSPAKSPLSNGDFSHEGDDADGVWEQVGPKHKTVITRTVGNNLFTFQFALQTCIESFNINFRIYYLIVQSVCNF